MIDLIEAILASPIGVALLALLEARRRPDLPFAPFDPPPDSDPDAVARAARHVGEMSFGKLCEAALDGADRFAGPWNPNAPRLMTISHRDAMARRPIAEAVAARLDAVPAGIDRERQEWWLGEPSAADAPRARFGDLDHVYSAGEFTFDGLWTVTDPPAETHDELIAVWELREPTISRWRFPVQPRARVWEIHRPDDWVRLVATYPKLAKQAHSGWELPGPNQRDPFLADLCAASAGRAARTAVERHLVPDWTAVAADYDGVHLSWAGFVTTEGFVSDLAGGGVTMLRYWGSERTLWLADVFGDPVPLDAPTLLGYVNGIVGVDVRSNENRRDLDQVVMRMSLGR